MIAPRCSNFNFQPPGMLGMLNLKHCRNLEHYWLLSGWPNRGDWLTTTSPCHNSSLLL
jgi:hypothetical protein